MVKLAKHLWDQLINDEEAAKHWLTGLKTAALALAVQVGVATAGDVAKALAWGKAQWFAVAVTTLIAAGAKVADPVVK